MTSQNLRQYRRSRNSVKVYVHDFPDPELGKAAPYGVDDLNQIDAAASLGITYGTAEFTVKAIRHLRPHHSQLARCTSGNLGNHLQSDRNGAGRRCPGDPLLVGRQSSIDG